jgi:EthD domain
MVKRKPGLSPEEFRDGYENSHSRIAVSLFGHLWLEYRRNYLHAGRTFEGKEGGPDSIEYDAISEFILPDAAALEEMGRISAANFAMIKEDEARWFDQAKCWVVAAETVEEKLNPGR